MYRYERRESKLKKTLKTFLLIVGTSVISIFLHKMYLDINIKDNLENAESGATAIHLSSEEKAEEDISSKLENITKCVVGISKIKNNDDTIFEVNATQNLSLGTGTIISEKGYIITNWHLAGNKYSSCYVTLDNLNVHKGEVIWADENLDLAIIKINAKGLNYLSLGDSNNINIGEEVYAIGNPIGMEFQRTVTSGIISGVNRTIKITDNKEESYMEGLIQTDASINGGNSGGPLINKKGEVIGINTVKIETAEGIGFAVPINTIKPIIDSFITTGSFEEAYLGIFAYDKEAIRYLKNNVTFEGGIYVVKIMKDGALATSSIKPGDIITKIDGIEINRMSELRHYIYTQKPGDKVILTVNRNNKEHQEEVVLKKK